MPSQLIRVVSICDLRHFYTQPHITKQIAHILRIKLNLDGLSKRPIGDLPRIDYILTPVIFPKVRMPSCSIRVEERLRWIFAKQVRVLLSNSFK